MQTSSAQWQDSKMVKDTSSRRLGADSVDVHLVNWLREIILGSDDAVFLKKCTNT